MPQPRVETAVAPPPEPQSPWVQLRSAMNHPFVYRKMVRAADPAARAGDVVNLYDKAGLLFGRGLYNPHSQIVVRVLAFGDVPIDEPFWRGRLEQAVALRRMLRLDEVTDAYRLVHAEGDGLSGLIAERYADWLVFEFFSRGMFDRHAELARLLAEILGPPTALDRPDRAGPQWHIALRADARIEKIERFHVPLGARSPGAKGPRGRGEEGTAVAAAKAGGAAPRPDELAALPRQTVPPPRPPPTPAPPQPPHPERLIIREHGIRYRVDVQQGHKTGFFCDQRDNRRRLGELCRDASVLDLCCYTGGFSLCAAKLGGAHEVTGVDLDEAAIAIAHENANLNQARVNFVYADAFTYMRQMLANQRQFDVVVLDPPKLVTYRPELDEGLRKYYDLNHLAVQMARPGGLLVTCSCSGLVSGAAFLETVQRAAQRAGRNLQMLDRTAAAPDHPVMLNCPESAYLKVLWFRVL